MCKAPRTYWLFLRAAGAPSAGHANALGVFDTAMQAVQLDHCADPFGDLLGSTVRIHRSNQAGAPVVIGKRCGLLLVNVKPSPDHIRPVVEPLKQLAATGRATHQIGSG